MVIQNRDEAEEQIVVDNFADSNVWDIYMEANIDDLKPKVVTVTNQWQDWLIACFDFWSSKKLHIQLLCTEIHLCAVGELSLDQI